MTKILVRRDTAANWTTNNPTLAAGEFGLETNTNFIKRGDGATAWATLPYFNNLASQQDVSITTLLNGQVLVWNSTSTKWENATPSPGVTDHDLLSNIGTNDHDAIDSFIDSVGDASGICPLNASSQIDATYLPASVLGALEYQGVFDASTHSYPATPETGWYYVCSVAGTITADSKAYTSGDWAVYNGTTWDKIDATDAVVSVDGATGAVSLAASYVAIPGSGAQGDILYHNGTGYVRLGAGTAGKVLSTGGAAANPSWADIDGGASI